jgi:autotransporter-associated beta strand protein
LRVDSADESCYEKRSEAAGGTVIFNSDVYLPYFSLSGGAHMIIRGGSKFVSFGTVKTDKATTYSCYQTGTIDIEDGIFAPKGFVSFAQTPESDLVVNVGEKGVLDSGTQGLRLANNGKVTINLRGGKFFFRSNVNYDFAEHGTTIVNIYGGSMVIGNNGTGDTRMLFGYNSSKEVDFPPAALNLAGGEIVFAGFKNQTKAGNRSDDPLDLFFDGGVMRMRLSGNVFSFANDGTPAQIRARVRKGGLKIDTREYDVVWNDVELLGNDGEEPDGGLVKTGCGKFTIAAPSRFKGTAKITGGGFHVEDPEYFTAPLDLRPKSTLSFEGETLELAKLSSKGGVVALSAGQKLSLGESPDVDGLLVFDVDASTAGSHTLLEAPELAEDLAGKCAVLTPSAGKSCAFSVAGGALVLTVSDGTEPAAPQFPASEDPEFIAYGERTHYLESGSEGWQTLALNNGRLEYAAKEDLALPAGSVRLQSSSTVALLPGSGDLTFAGPFDLSTTAASLNPVVTLSSSIGNKICFTGDWSSYGYPRTTNWCNFSCRAGDYVFGPDLSGFFVNSFKFYPETRFTFDSTELNFPASLASAERNPAIPGDPSRLILDGVTLRATGEDGGSFGDYLAGVSSLSLGSGGAVFDTCGNDVTIKQTLAPTGWTQTAGLVKQGAGSLALGGRLNWMTGPLAILEGTLKAGFDTGVHRLQVPGAVALYTFDGENPYADKSGNGYDLAQAHVEDGTYTTVGFTESNALAGKSAIFAVNGKKSSLKATNIDSTSFAKQTVSAWVRFESLKRTLGNLGIVSTRSDAGMQNTGNNFDLAYKEISKTNGVSLTGNKMGFGTIWAGAQATIWDDVVGGGTAKAPSTQEWHHLVMVNDSGTFSSYLDGVCYVDRYKAKPISFLSSGYLLTIGQGTCNGEFMNKGGMIDEVAVYNRALSAEEVGMLYAGEARMATFPVTVAAGATWDMNGVTSTVTSVTGDGSVVNGQLAVSEGVNCGPGRTLHIENPVFADGEGVLDFGYGESEKAPLNRKIRLFTFDEMSEESAANLKMWTVGGIGARAELRIGRIAVEDGVVYGIVSPKSLTLVVR